MNNLKEQLKRELRADVPFTEDMKQRMLVPNRPVNKRIKKQYWRFPLIVLTFVLILGFVLKLQFTPQESTAAKTVATLPTDPYDLVNLLQKNETVLPIIESNDSAVIEPTISYVMGKQWPLSYLPMVIDPQATIAVGDYIAYYDMYDIVVSPVFGVECDKVQTLHGQVTLNGELLALPGAVAPVQFSQPKQQEIFKYYFIDRSHTDTPQSKSIDVELAPLQKNEFAVYTYNKGSTVKMINDGSLIGKVVGFKKFEPTFTLNEEEQSLYHAFKENYDLNVLLGVDPVSIAKMYAIAEAQRDYATKLALYTTRDVPERSEIVKYMQDTQPIREYYATEEIQRLLSAYMFNGMEEAEFEQIDDIEGTIQFIPEYGNSSKRGATMIKNEQGIWQPLFTSPFE